jgi:uncharacterized protein DUF5684
MHTIAASGAGGGIITIIYLAVVVLEIAALWQLFAKAGQPGWAAIIPIYNTIVWLKVVGRPLWWFVLLLIPLVNIVMYFILALDLAKSFGRGTGFGVATFFFPYVTIPMLGFGSAQYQGPAASPQPVYAGASSF